MIWEMLNAGSEALGCPETDSPLGRGGAAEPSRRFGVEAGARIVAGNGKTPPRMEGRAGKKPPDGCRETDCLQTLHGAADFRRGATPAGQNPRAESITAGKCPAQRPGQGAPQNAAYRAKHLHGALY